MGQKLYHEHVQNYGIYRPEIPEDKTLAKRKQKPKLAVHAKVTNRRVYFRCSPAAQVRLKKIFRYRANGYEYSEKFQAGTWDGWINPMHGASVPAGLFLRKLATIRKRFALTVEDRTVKIDALPYKPSPDDRPYQRNAVRALRRQRAVGGLLICATQTGKTRIASRYFASIRETVVFIVDELTLLHQAKETLGQITGEPIGQMGGGQHTTQRITVATIQTLHRNLKNPEYARFFSEISVVAIDEIHIMLNPSVKSVVQRIRPKAVFGLTASLDRTDRAIATEAYALAGPVLYEYTIRKGVRQGYLSKAVAVALRVPPCIVARQANPQQTYRAAVVVNALRNDIIAELAEEASRRNHRTLIFVTRIEHIHLLDKLIEVPHRCLHGEHTQAERIEVRDAFDRGEVPILIASSIFIHGIVLKTLDCVIDATAGRSVHLTIQKFGRSANKTAEKSRIVHIDISDSTAKLRKTTTERQYTLMSLCSKVVHADWELLRSAGKVFDLAEM